MKKIAIIGSGSWGCSLAIHLAKRGNKVGLWSFNEDEKNLINNERKCKYLPEAVMHENITATTDYKEAIEGSEFVLHVTPSKFTRENVKKYKQFITNQPVIMCSKGFEFDTLYSLDEVLQEEMPNAKIGALSGPSHAEEVFLGIPTALVIASKHPEVINEVRDAFMSESVRVYASDDVRGVELGAALKNIVAFCAGATASMNLGDNTLAALITRGLAEISRLGTAMGGQKDTFYGLTGLGDLIVTCLSEHSRNRRAGFLIGSGKTLEETKKEVGMVIESIDNIQVAYKLAQKYNVEMPIVNIVYDVLYNNLDPKDGVNILMTRRAKNEKED